MSSGSTRSVSKVDAGTSEAIAGDGESAEVVHMLGGPVLQLRRAGRVEQHVDHGALRGREQHLVDERLALVPAAVAADELHARAPAMARLKMRVFAVLTT